MKPEDKTKKQMMMELESLYQNLEQQTPSPLGIFTAQELLLNASTAVRRIFDLANVLIMALDCTGTVILINRRGCSILEGNEEQILNRNWFSTFIPESERAKVQAFFADLIQGRAELASTNTNRIVTLTGLERMISWSNKVLKDRDGNIVAIVSSGQDITELHKQQEELKHSEEKHRILVEASQDAIFLETVSGEILDCNRRACEMFGYKKTELTSMSIVDLLRPELASSIPEFKSKQLANGGMFIEAENRRKDGTYFPVEVSTKLLHVESQPLVIVYVRDITERKRNQLQLQAQASRLKVLREIDRCILSDEPPCEVAALAVSCLDSLFNCQRIGLLEYDAELEQLKTLAAVSDDEFQFGSVCSCSREQWAQFKFEFERRGMFGFTAIDDLASALPGLIVRAPDTLPQIVVSNLLVKEDLVGILVLAAGKSTCIFDDDVHTIMEICNQVAISIHQARLTAKNYEYMNFLEQKVNDRTLELQQRITLTERLITKIRKKNRQLQKTMERLSKANDELEAFSYSISHDLRAHVRRVDYYSNLLLDEGKDRLSKDDLEYVTRIISETSLMDLMIKDILDYSRMTRCADALVPVNLGACFLAAIKTLEPEFQKTKAQIKLPDTFPLVLAQATLLTNIIGNLLSNALKFSRPGVPAIIHVDLETLDDTHCVWVQDNGIGIEPAAQTRVFELFERLNPAELYPGTGVGLAIVKRGMLRLQGDVVLESQPGVGSKFGLVLKKVS